MTPFFTFHSRRSIIVNFGKDESGRDYVTHAHMLTRNPSRDGYRYKSNETGDELMIVLLPRLDLREAVRCLDQIVLT